MRKLLDILPTVAARRSQLLPRKNGHHVDLLDLSAAVFDHFGNGCLLRAETADCLLHVTARVEFAVAA